MVCGSYWFILIHNGSHHFILRFVCAVTSGNFMVDVKNSASSFRLLALFPPYIRTAASGLSDSAVSIRRKEITHRGMQALFANMETVLNNPLDFLCADGKYRRLVPMLHFLNMDGALMKTGMAENGA